MRRSMWSRTAYNRLLWPRQGQGRGVTCKRKWDAKPEKELLPPVVGSAPQPASAPAAPPRCPCLRSFCACHFTDTLAYVGRLGNSHSAILSLLKAGLCLKQNCQQPVHESPTRPSCSDELPVRMSQHSQNAISLQHNTQVSFTKVLSSPSFI